VLEKEAEVGCRDFFEIFSKNCWIIQKKRIFAEKYGMKWDKIKLK